MLQNLIVEMHHWAKNPKDDRHYFKNCRLSWSIMGLVFLTSFFLLSAVIHYGEFRDKRFMIEELRHDLKYSCDLPEIRLEALRKNRVISYNRARDHRSNAWVLPFSWKEVPYLELPECSK